MVSPPPATWLLPWSTQVRTASGPEYRLRVRVRRVVVSFSLARACCCCVVRCDLLGTIMGMCAQRYAEVLLRDRLSFRSVGYSYYPFYWKHTDTPL